MSSLLVVGCGKMGGIILESAVKSGLFKCIDVVEPSVDGKRAVELKYGDNVAVHNKIPPKNVDIVIVCVKPWMVKEVITELQTVKVHVIASIAAGVTLTDLQSMHPQAPMVRIMPNTPCQVAHGMTAIVSNETRKIDPKHLQTISDLFTTMGRVVQWQDERLLDVFTALCGSGPGMMLTVLEAFADGACLHGLSKPLAIEFAAQTMLGTAKLLLENSGTHPSVLRDEVCTPGGCTIAGICTLHQEGVPGSVIKAVSETIRRLQ